MCSEEVPELNYGDEMLSRFTLSVSGMSFSPRLGDLNVKSRIDDVCRYE